MLALAERYYRTPGLAEKILANAPRRNIDNLLAGRVVSRSAAGCRVAVGTATLAAANLAARAEVLACARAEEVELLAPAAATAAAQRLPGRRPRRISAGCSV